MSLAGHLSELALPDLLQIVAMAEKSGRLDLTNRDGEGLIVFRSGRVIYAASNAARETLGSILVCRHMVSEEVLHKALEHQFRSREERRLGSILVEMGAVSLDALESVIYQQIQRVIGELVKWRDGYFKFEAMEIPDHGEIAVDAREFLAESGFNAHRIALELSRIADEARQEHAAGGAEGAVVSAAAVGAGVGVESDGGVRQPSSLGSILAARPTPSLTAERSMELLRAGEGFFSRAVLLLVERYGLTGVGQFGVRAGDATVDESIRNLWLQLGAASLVAEAVATGRTCRGRLERTDANQLLVSELGGEWPVEAAALPIKAGPHLVAVLYGDGMPIAAPLPALDRLEARLAEIGAAIAAAERVPASQPRG
ncbi:MAG: hypothetical protein B7Z61_07975 [Acidobacteria bacterium 37-71-11]|nr:MAG: hypothetical protein B7Z61_07975 [Acidobacteria bacterium 37-71-11]HQT95191.1 DUF4388 domain-containing protein [Thermoanaerobaculaceae bacterium]